MAKIKTEDIVKYLNNKVRIKGKPTEGENVAVFVRPGDKIDVEIPGLDLEELQYKLIGGDIVLLLPDGSKFTFVSMALMGYDNTPPSLNFAGGKTMTLEAILSEIEYINDLPLDSVVASENIQSPEYPSDIEKEFPKVEEDSNPMTPIIEQIAEEIDANKLVSELEEMAPPEDPVEVVEPIEEVIFTDDDSSTNTQTQTSVTEGINPTLTFDINIQHIRLEDGTSLDGTTRVTTVQGGGGTGYGNIYPDSNATVDRSEIIKQTNSETIDYRTVDSSTADKVIINADNADYFSDSMISRSIELDPSQPEGFAIESITISSSDFPAGFEVVNATQSGNSWTLTKDDPNTEAIEGFTRDVNGIIQINFKVSSDQEANFEFTIAAESVFNIENVSEENRATIEEPVQTILNFEKTYGVNLKQIDTIGDSNEYLFEPFLNGSGETVSTGFVISTNLNDNIIYGSQTLENTIYGGFSNDTVTAGNQDDVIFGNDGDDTFTLGLGDDTVTGGDGNDTLDFSSIDKLNNIGIEANLLTGIITGDGTDAVSQIENIIGTQDNDILMGNNEINILKGENGTDTLFGYLGDDTLEGGVGNDTLEGGLGDDVLKGGTGIDTVSYANATSATTAGVNVSLEDDVNNPGIGSATGIDGIDTLYDFENVVGSNYNDTIIGNGAANIINALDGDDHIVALMGNDTIYGGDGVDTIDFSNASSSQEVDLTINRARGAEGTDRIYEVENVIGSDFVDTLIGDAQNNILDGGEENDTIFGGAGNDELYGGYDNDTLYGGVGDDIIDGEEGNDTASYADVITGGVEVSLKTQGVAQNTINAGNDTLNGIENLVGTAFNDTLHGDSNANSLIGGSGDDTISTGGIATLGEDYIDGGSGSNDLITFTDSPNSISIDLAITTTQDSGFGNLIIKNIENVEGSSHNDLIKGNADANTLYGFDGDDTLIGRGGNDFLDGGVGVDEVNYSEASLGVNLTLAEAGLTATASIGAEQDTIKDIENITGSNFADVLGGNRENNSIDAGAGDDSLIASDGNDIFVGNIGNDTVDYSARSNSINVELNGNQQAILQESNVKKDSLFGIENVIGSTANDTITGDDQDNTLRGQEGDDTLYGSSGNDYIDGGEGGETNGDTVDFSSATITGVSVDLSSNAQQFVSSSEGFDTFINIENVIGSNYNDVLTGNSEDNTLDGGAGDDTLKGGAGDDHFIGGVGVDTVDYSDVTQDLNVDLKSLAPTEVAPGQGTDTFDSIEGVIGGSGDDTLVGTSGANNIIGGNGDDTLVGFGVTDGSGGVDSLDGGAGTDLISFGFTSNNLSVDLSNSSEQNTGVGKLVVTNVENIYGGYGNDTLTGDDEDNSIYGSFGSDTLIGNGGNDTLNGGKDSDSHRITITNTGLTFTVVVGAITLTTTAAAEDVMLNDIVTKFNEQNSDGSLGTILKDGNELLLQTEQTVNVTNGIDTSSTFIDVVDYSSFSTDSIDVDLNDALEQVNITDGSKDTLIDIEKIIATNQSDNIVGDDKDNIFIGLDGNDIIDGGAGNDIIDGGAGNDTITGGAGIDILDGGLGDDKFIASSGDGIDTIDGGEGSDTLDYSSFSEVINVTLNGATQTRVKIGVTEEEEDYIENIENVISGGGNDTLVGDASNNTFISNGGDDTLTGGLGNDYLDGGDNTAYTDGSVKTGDTVDYSYIDSVAAYNIGIDVDLSKANNQATDLAGGNQVGTDELKNIENIIATNYDDSVVGNASENTIVTKNGNDFLVGNAGNDYLDAGDGNDILKGGIGDDYLAGGAGIDTADFSDATGSINVDLLSSGSVDIGAGLGSDYFDSIEGAIGGAFDDTIKGTTGANSLLGNGGDDTLLGGGASTGYDYINGGEGGETNGDFVSYSYIKDETQDVTINLGLTYGATDGGHAYDDADGAVDTYQNAGAAGNLQIVDIENIEGGAGDDTLIGNADGNQLIGGVGNDWLRGAAGNNTLIGGEAIDSDSLTIDETNSDALAGLGIDTADYSKITSDFGIVANMNAGSDTATIQTGQVTYNGISVDTLYGIENIRASKNDDTIIGDSDDNVVNTFEGMEGKDVINGGSGADIIYGEQIGNADLGVTDLTTLADTLSGGAGNDTIYGQAGDDTLIGNEGADTLDGGAGSDTVDYSYLNSGSNRVTVNFTTNTTNTANDGSDTDTLVNIENANGSINNDTFIMATGTTSNGVDGKEGVDTIDYSNYTTNAITVNLGTTASQEIVTGDNDTIKNIENIIATTLNDTITGSNEDNSLDGNEGSDRFFSSDGDDIINGGVDATSNDTDIADYSNASQRIIVSNGDSVDKTNGFTDTLHYIEQIQGTDYKDTMSGGAGIDIFKGGANDDVLSGGANDDTLYGEDGNDTLSGGLGDDELRGGTNLSTGDTVDYSSRNEAVTLTLNAGAATVTVGSSGEQDSIYEIENIIGSQEDDNITGDDNANALDGNDGNDILNGAAGIDTIKGGIGNDIINGGADADYLYGEDGNDTFVGTTFFGDEIDGGADTTGDTVDYSSLNDSVEVILNDTSKSNVKVGSQTTDHTIENIENIIFIITYYIITLICSYNFFNIY